MESLYFKTTASFVELMMDTSSVLFTTLRSLPNLSVSDKTYLDQKSKFSQDQRWVKDAALAFSFFI